MKKQTPVEWLEEQLPIRIRNMHSDDILKAKEMEREAGDFLEGFEEIGISQFLGCVFENENYFIEATILVDGDGEILKGEVDVEFTDKRFKQWRVEHWDNALWMIAVYEGVEESIKGIEHLDLRGIRCVRGFFKNLIDKGWI
jgi:hypothetical protein